MAKVLLLLRHTVREFQEDDCTHMAAGVAYYAMFSIFPLLLGLVAVLGMLLDADALQAQLADAVSAVLPGTGDPFVLYLEHFATYNLVYGPLTSVIAFLFWAYISALVLLFGAELSSEYARLYGSHARG